MGAPLSAQLLPDALLHEIRRPEVQSHLQRRLLARVRLHHRRRLRPHARAVPAVRLLAHNGHRPRARAHPHPPPELCAELAGEQRRA
nr:hypothetical protein orf34 [uncultured archaeon]